MALHKNPTFYASKEFHAFMMLTKKQLFDALRMHVQLMASLDETDPDWINAYIEADTKNATKGDGSFSTDMELAKTLAKALKSVEKEEKEKAKRAKLHEKIKKDLL